MNQPTMVAPAEKAHDNVSGTLDEIHSAAKKAIAVAIMGMLDGCRSLPDDDDAALYEVLIALRGEVTSELEDLIRGNATLAVRHG